MMAARCLACGKSGINCFTLFAHSRPSSEGLRGIGLFAPRPDKSRDSETMPKRPQIREEGESVYLPEEI